MPEAAPGMQSICDDLSDEHASLDHLVGTLREADWSSPTPAPGWTIRDQISHLAFFDEQAVMAIRDPELFEQKIQDLLADSANFGELGIGQGRERSEVELLERWRLHRANLTHALASVNVKDRIMWFGLTLSAMTFATARLMETWAHGYDIADSLGVEPKPTDRLRHIAHLGVQTRTWSYQVHARPAPTTPIRVELTSPTGDIWTWGDESAPDTIRGMALDFCLVVAQRRHLDDTDLATEGPLARDWLLIAQVYAGPPGAGRAAGMGNFDSASVAKQG